MSKKNKLIMFKRSFLCYRVEIIKKLNNFGGITALVGGGIVIAMGIAGMASNGSEVTYPNFVNGIIDLIFGCCGVVAGVFEGVLIILARDFQNL